MNAILVRVAADASYGKCNGPVDPDSGEFVYIPIPEVSDARFHPDCRRSYAETLPILSRFAESRTTPPRRFDLPRNLHDTAMHLDPDFEHLTYGDVGNRRGAGLAKMVSGDMVVFYAGLRPIRPMTPRLVYALIGVYVVEEVLPAAGVTPDRFAQNAHTRKVNRGEHDIVIRGRRGVSGRFKSCIPIGEYRDRAYRVRPEVLDAWGGLSVKDGYIQRSAVPPRFSNPERFRDWLTSRAPALAQSNW